MAFIPSNEVFVDYLTNVSSREMNVDGSVSPIIFEYDVPDRLALLEIKLLISTATDMEASTFGDLPALTNGIQISAGTNTFADIKNNEDLAQQLNLAELEPRFGSGGLRTAIFRSLNPREIIIEDSDVIAISVRDDLTSLLRMTAFVFGYKIT